MTFTPLLKSITIDQISLNSCLASLFSSTEGNSYRLHSLHLLRSCPTWPSYYFGRCYFQFQKHSLQTHPFPSTCITVLKKNKKIIIIIKKPSDHKSTFILVASTKWLSNLSCVVLRTRRNKLIYKKIPEKQVNAIKKCLKHTFPSIDGSCCDGCCCIILKDDF
jgi:hypothetical protein